MEEDMAMRKILKFISKNTILYSIIGVWALILLVICDLEVIKYINWNVDFQQWYTDNPRHVLIILIFLNIVWVGLIVIKVLLKKTERVLIIQDGMDEKELPITELSKLYETQNFRTHITNYTKKDIEDDLAVMLRDFNKINNKNIGYISYMFSLFHRDICAKI